MAIFLSLIVHKAEPALNSNSFPPERDVKIIVCQRGDRVVQERRAEQTAEVRVRRHSDVPDCDVIVVFGGREISLRCRNYKQAVEWARIECKSYKIAGGFTVES